MTIKNPSLDDISSLKALWKEAFGDSDAFINSFFESAYSDKRCFCAKDGEALCAALYIFDCEIEEKRIAYIYAVATKKEYRGKGICSLLMQETHKRLKEIGYDGAILVPAQASLFGFYEKLGYKISSYVGEIKASAAKDKTEATEIGAMEYAKLRRDFLPSGSLIQENENLDFLALQAKFYKGDGFVTAIRLGEKIFSAIEFLGDKNIIERVIAALGYTKGIARIPEQSVPFAMYYQLSERKPRFPIYIGFAFD